MSSAAFTNPSRDSWGRVRKEKRGDDPTRWVRAACDGWPVVSVESLISRDRVTAFEKQAIEESREIWNRHSGHVH